MGLSSCKTLPERHLMMSERAFGHYWSGATVESNQFNSHLLWGPFDRDYFSNNLHPIILCSE